MKNLELLLLLEQNYRHYNCFKNNYLSHRIYKAEKMPVFLKETLEKTKRDYKPHFSPKNLGIKLKSA